MSDNLVARLSTGSCIPSFPNSLPPTKSDLPKLTPMLPIEIIEQISQFLFALISPTNHDDASVISWKPPWSAVSGFMSASPELHAMGFVRWVQVLTIHKSEDWNRALELSELVLELRCQEGAFPATDKAILTRFGSLCAVYIDSHNDVVRRESGQFAYRDLFNALPSSLLRIEIAHAHGPDLKVIKTVRKCCPNLLVLKLGRCSMFNRVPACDFWIAFPTDHDAYIAAVGTDDFAHSVAQELVSLSQLKTLRIGVYFMLSTAVLAHRAYHVRGLPAPEPLDWQQAISDLRNLSVPEPPQRLDTALLVELYHQDVEQDFSPNSCSFCHESFQPSREAERRANAAVKRLLPSLQTMEWMDWFSPSHLAVSRYAVGNLVTPGLNAT